MGTTRQTHLTIKKKKKEKKKNPTPVSGGHRLAERRVVINYLSASKAGPDV